MSRITPSLLQKSSKHVKMDSSNSFCFYFYMIYIFGYFCRLCCLSWKSKMTCGGIALKFFASPRLEVRPIGKIKPVSTMARLWHNVMYHLKQWLPFVLWLNDSNNPWLMLSLSPMQPRLSIYINSWSVCKLDSWKFCVW